MKSAFQMAAGPTARLLLTPPLLCLCNSRRKSVGTGPAGFVNKLILYEIINRIFDLRDSGGFVRFRPHHILMIQ